MTYDQMKESQKEASIPTTPIKDTLPLQSERKNHFFTPDKEQYVMLEKADSPELGLSVYRNSEVVSLMAATQKSSFTHLDATSGTGTSKFILPEIERRMGGKKKVQVIETIGSSDLGTLELTTKKGQTIILDEFPLLISAYKSAPEILASKLKQLSEEKGVHFIFAIGETDENRDYLARLKTAITSEDIPQIVVRPKPFNEGQAREYFEEVMKGDNRLAKRTDIFDPLFNYILEHSNSLPLHFKWMRSAVREFAHNYIKHNGEIPAELVKEIMGRYEKKQDKQN